MTNSSYRRTLSIAAAGLRLRQATLERHPWLAFCLPWIVYMLLGSLEPTFPPSGAASDRSNTKDQASVSRYPLFYTVKIALTLGTIAVVWPSYWKFPFHMNWRAPVVGAIGFGVWVGLCGLRIEERWLAPWGLGWFVDLGRRSAYDPFRELAACWLPWFWAFLAVRLAGLVIVVPIIEEFFLRAFLIPFVRGQDERPHPFGAIDGTAVLVAVLYGITTHPAELVAAAVWFTLITWLMVRTRNIWDCVVAHAVTNLLLGLYVLWSGEFQLW